MVATSESAPVRLAEVVAALSLGIDLGFSQPMEHVLRQWLIALRLAERVGLDDTRRAAVYYGALLVNVGCHSDAHEQAKWFGDDRALKATKFDYEPRSAREALGTVRLLGAGGSPLHRLRTGLAFATSGRRDVEDMLSQHASLARQLAERLELPTEVGEALACSYERWDGRDGLECPDRQPLATDHCPFGSTLEERPQRFILSDNARCPHGWGGWLVLPIKRRNSHDHDRPDNEDDRAAEGRLRHRRCASRRRRLPGSAAACWTPAATTCEVSSSGRPTCSSRSTVGPRRSTGSWRSPVRTSS